VGGGLGAAAAGRFFWIRAAPHGALGWLAPYATFEFAFAIVLIAAARAGFASGIKDWRTVLRLISILPIFVALVWAFGLYSRVEAYYASHAVVAEPGCTSITSSPCAAAPGLARAFSGFRWWCWRPVFLELHAGVVSVRHRWRAAVGLYYCTMRPTRFPLMTAWLAFAAMAMWSESQIDRIGDCAAELDHVRRESEQGPYLDALTAC